MQNINCNVSVCSHNKSNTCYANRVDIGGGKASKDCQTCCGSFLNQETYGSLTNNTNDSGNCSTLVCKAHSCAHNCNDLCSLSSINVNGDDVQIYTQTFCESFCEKL